MDYQTQHGPGPEKKNKNLMVALIVAAFLGISAVVCCFGMVGMGVFTAFNVDKTYYAECQDATDGEECRACCRARGHNGNAYGAVINEDGYVCGCL